MYHVDFRCANRSQYDLRIEDVEVQRSLPPLPPRPEACVAESVLTAEANVKFTVRFKPDESNPDGIAHWVIKPGGRAEEGGHAGGVQPQQEPVRGGAVERWL